MSTAEILSLISLISFIASGVCLALAVFFWFKFRIPFVIGYLSGRSAKRSIAQMWEQNEKASARSGTASPIRVKQSAAAGAAPGAAGEGAKDAKRETRPLQQEPAVFTAAEKTVRLNTAPVKTDTPGRSVTRPSGPPERAEGKKLTMLDEVILIHTDEVIE